MRSPPLIQDAHFCVSGDVTIHPTAAIAPGVMLQADPGCQLVISAGTCIGIGSILHASQGNLVLEAGVTLGSGVLIVGAATVGTNACIGSASTLLNQSIEPQQIVPAGSLMGDESRQVALAEQSGEFAGSAPEASSSSPSRPTGSSFSSSPPAEPAPEVPRPTQVVYGRAYLERIMVTMFPHRQAVEPPQPTSE